MKIKNSLIFIVFILFSFSVLGFGATQPGTVFVPAGESKIVDFSVQNGGGAKEDVVATLAVVDGEEIVELVEDNKYSIPINGEVIAKVKVKVPANANTNDKWNVKLSFRAEPVGSSIPSGMVSLGYGVDIKFDVVASEPAEETAPFAATGEATKELEVGNILIALILLASAAIAGRYYLRKRKNSSSLSSRSTEKAKTKMAASRKRKRR
ncbi:hypothetical protein HYT56_05435 [Candidatus Woesearchaeota archaeon]|nr:hypothetical protein [Candidatus Woesearchaeota archaeon]